MRLSILIYISKYICILPIIFFQCAYFNTFYIAEESFEKAIQILEKAPILDDNKMDEETSSKIMTPLVEKAILLDSTYADAYAVLALTKLMKPLFLSEEKSTLVNDQSLQFPLHCCSRA